MQTLLAARLRSRAWYLVATIGMVVAGLASRHFPGWLPSSLGKYPGDALWSLMVFFGLGSIFHHAASVQVGLGALGCSFGIEALKLCRATWLVNMRHTALGHLVFGSAFSWQNLVAYAIGILVGLVIEEFFAKPRRAAGWNHPT